MASTSTEPRDPRAMVLLEQTPEDEAAGVYRVQAHTGAIVRLTARQMEIMSMPIELKQHVPQVELVELGKLLMPLQESGIDDMLRQMDENPREVPEFVPEPYEHTPLKKPTSLRLIQIMFEDEDGMLHVSLDEFDLDEHVPHYCCLSYCWSNPHAKSNIINYYNDFADDYDDQNVFPISCNGRLMYVRANLYDALKQLPEAPGLQVKRWCNFNGTLERFTDLHAAAADGNVGLTKTNIFRGAHINTRDSLGRTALMLAIINGHFLVVKALLEAGADLQIRDFHNLTCIDHALNNDRHEITDYLLTFNPDSVEKYQRKHKHVGHGTRIWIDAICINQDDLQEKSEQVSVMDRIYTQASFVVIWLGKDDSTGALSASAVSKLFSVIRTKDSLADAGIRPYQATDFEIQSQTGVPSISQHEWVALALLYLRQHFHRLWCLQEAVLPEDVVMYLGEHEIPWNEFMMVTEQLHMLQKTYTIPPSVTFRPVYTAPVEAEAHLISELRMRKTLDESSPEQRKAWFRDSRRFWRGENEPCQIPLLEMLPSTTTFECFDPRDHIYALIGMCKNHRQSPKIDIDYEKPYEEIYTDVMRLYLAYDPRSSLELVAAIKDSALTKNENLPGWVYHFGQAGVSSVWDYNYSAAGAQSEAFDVGRSSSGRSNELIIDGHRIDIINEVANARPMDGQVSMFNFDPTWSGLMLSLPQMYPHTKESRTEVLWRTLCRDTPSKDDIRLSRQAHSQTDQANSTEPLSAASKAPEKYAVQFRDQFCASILSHAEKAADWNLNLKLSRGGVLLQAMMALQLPRSEDPNASNVHHIMAPSEEEVKSMHDTSLEGPYYSDSATHQAIEELELIHQADATEFGGPGCATPSRAQIAAFLKEPPFRVWRPNASHSSRGISITEQVPAHGPDSQILDNVPPGEDGFRSQFALSNGGRRLFVTQDQQYLGIGGMSMRPGDEVWAVKGSRVPFLLRKVGEEEIEDVANASDKTRPSESDAKGKSAAKTHRRFIYKYIGDLYVHGIMKGEAVSSDSTWEEIALV